MAQANQRLAFVGAGAIAEAVIRGLLLSRRYEPGEILVSDRRPDRLAYMRETFAVETTPENDAAAAATDTLVLAVKPQIFTKILEQVASAIQPDCLVLTLAAGVSTERVERSLGPAARVVRAMPNVPAFVGAAATAMAPGESAREQDVESTRSIFEAIGTVVQVDENLLDAVTGLSGSGPAYVFMIIEALADAGVQVGLPRYQAQALAAQTVLGSAKLLLETGQHPGVLKDQVTSPGGTAIVGLHTLEEGGLRTTLINAVVAAAERSAQLGRGIAG